MTFTEELKFRESWLSEIQDDAESAVVQNNMAKNYGLYQTQVPAVQGKPAPPSVPHSVPGRQYHGILQTVQRQDGQHGRHQNPVVITVLLTVPSTFITKTPRLTFSRR